ncbi:terminal uridylyltransferase 7-like [Tachypleus tridentatus]|uniref:terminal uridylyltransferase 7-like n=1 Tax=Tachypleus tridentatus TaxID=6853 RepID=UPI003FD41351
MSTDAQQACQKIENDLKTLLLTTDSQKNSSSIKLDTNATSVNEKQVKIGKNSMMLSSATFQCNQEEINYLDRREIQGRKRGRSRRGKNKSSQNKPMSKDEGESTASTHSIQVQQSVDLPMSTIQNISSQLILQNKTSDSLMVVNKIDQKNPVARGSSMCSSDGSTEIVHSPQPNLSENNSQFSEKTFTDGLDLNFQTRNEKQSRKKWERKTKQKSGCVPEDYLFQGVFADQIVYQYNEDYGKLLPEAIQSDKMDVRKEKYEKNKNKRKKQQKKKHKNNTNNSESGHKEDQSKSKCETSKSTEDTKSLSKPDSEQTVNSGDSKKSSDATPKQFKEKSWCKKVNKGILIEDSWYSDEILEKLEEEFIFPLKKRVSRFPRAHFYCKLCDYHLDRPEHMKDHMHRNSHRSRKELQEVHAMLQDLPPPSSAHCEALTKLLVHVAENVGLSNREVTERQELVEKLNTYLYKSIPGIEARLYGSSINGFGLVGSDVNIDLILPVNEVGSTVLARTFQLLKESEDYSQVASDFTSKIPRITFIENKTGLFCNISLYNDSAYQTSQLLADYCSIDPRVKILGVVIRKWAKICEIDDASKGTLPAHSFPLMLIYYLQQCKPPVLPVLHELCMQKPGKVSSESETYLQPSKMADVWTCHNKQSIGELWVNLLRFYSFPMEHVISIRHQVPLKKNEKSWAKRHFAIEDAFHTKRNLARSVSNQHVFRYIQERFHAAYTYFGIPQLASGPLFTSQELISSRTKQPKLNTDEQNDASISDTSPINALIQELSEDRQNIVGKAELEPSTSDLVQQDKELNDENVDSESVKQKAFIDQCKPLEELLIPQHIFEQTSQRNQTLEKDHSLDDDLTPIHIEEQQVDSDTDTSLSDSKHEQRETEDLEVVTYESFLEDQDTDLSLDNVISVLTKLNLNSQTSESQMNETEEFSVEESVYEKEVQPAVEVNKDIDSLKKNNNKTTSVNNDNMSVHFNERKKKYVIPDHIMSVIRCLKPDEYHFGFYKDSLTNGKKPPIACSLCQKEGHLKQDCPDEKLPEIKPLPPMTESYLRKLDTICKDILRENAPDDETLFQRKELLLELEAFIRELYPDASLHLFGSSCNGFGFTDCDLDICLTFKDDEKGETCRNQHPAIIEKLAEKLHHKWGLTNIVAITTAKVPIVKFMDKLTRLEGDISLYNVLAQQNTRMLNVYSKIDKRVQILGYTMKKFTKICDISDASRGSLSSYAYILMVLYYLQQRNPPVIPVLQELHEPGEKPELIIDGWNAWFYDDIENLPRIWPDYGKNKESVGSLWFGLLCFYSEEFNFKELVISIRQKSQLTRFHKLWNTKSIAIEDPFDQNHNLGSGVSRKMHTYIMKTFIRAREMFGIPLERAPTGYDHVYDYLFDRWQLTDGLPPNDRGCRACGKIGHKVKDCSRRRATKDKILSINHHENNQEQNRKEGRQSSGSNHANCLITKGLKQDNTSTYKKKTWLNNTEGRKFQDLLETSRHHHWTTPKNSSRIPSNVSTPPGMSVKSRRNTSSSPEVLKGNNLQLPPGIFSLNHQKLVSQASLRNQQRQQKLKGQSPSINQQVQQQVTSPTRSGNHHKDMFQHMSFNQQKFIPQTSTNVQQEQQRIVSQQDHHKDMFQHMSFNQQKFIPQTSTNVQQEQQRIVSQQDLHNHQKPMPLNQVMCQQNKQRNNAHGFSFQNLKLMSQEPSFNQQEIMQQEKSFNFQTNIAQETHFGQQRKNTHETPFNQQMFKPQNSLFVQQRNTPNTPTFSQLKAVSPGTGNGSSMTRLNHPPGFQVRPPCPRFSQGHNSYIQQPQPYISMSVSTACPNSPFQVTPSYPSGPTTLMEHFNHNYPSPFTKQPQTTFTSHHSNTASMGHQSGSSLPFFCKPLRHSLSVPQGNPLIHSPPMTSSPDRLSTAGNSLHVSALHSFSHPGSLASFDPAIIASLQSTNIKGDNGDILPK